MKEAAAGRLFPLRGPCFRGALLGRTDCPDPDRVKNVSIFVLPGRSLQAKRRLCQELVARREIFGIPRACVLVRLHELPAENIAVRGGQAICDVELGYPVDV